MRRRDAVGLLASLIIGATGITSALSQARTVRVGVIAPAGLASFMSHALPELDRRGFREGNNLIIDAPRSAASSFADVARDIIGRGPDVLVAISTPAILAARAQSTSVPLVTYGPDPVLLGLAESAARPGGTTTGVVIASTELEPKRLQLLGEAVPGARRVGFLGDARGGEKGRIREELDVVARRLGFDLTHVEVESRQDYPRAFERFKAASVEAVMIGAHASLFRDVDELADRALAERLPTICEWREMAAQGCLIGYGASRAELYGRVGALTAMILAGQPAGLLPIERPTQLELGVNLRLARHLGLTIPPSLLARADEVIE